MNWTELNQTARFVDLLLADRLKSHTEPGVISEDGTVVLDDSGETSLSAPEGSDLEPGTEVYVTIRNGQYAAVTREEQERAEQAVKERAEQERRERARQKDEAREDAETFWNQYDIPFQWDVAIKGRLSGLTRGSSGTGRDSRTVEHLYVQEPFQDGRLERDAERYLCEPGARFRFDEGERRRDSEGREYTPPVTCQACLNLMERWEADGAD